MTEVRSMGFLFGFWLGNIFSLKGDLIQLSAYYLYFSAAMLSQKKDVYTNVRTFAKGMTAGMFIAFTAYHQFDTLTEVNVDQFSLK